MERGRELVLVVFIFMLGVFFSTMSLLNTKIKNSECVRKTKKETVLEFISHSAISGAVSVTVFAGLLHFVPEWSMLFQGAIAVMSAVISDTVIEAFKRKAEGVIK